LPVRAVRVIASTMIKEPHCPRCEQKMSLARSLPVAGSAPEIMVFECWWCEQQNERPRSEAHTEPSAVAVS